MENNSSTTFTDPAVQEKYQTDFPLKAWLHVPGGSGKGWKGQLANIPLWAADSCFEKKSNLLQLKNQDLLAGATIKGFDHLPGDV